MVTCHGDHLQVAAGLVKKRHQFMDETLIDPALQETARPHARPSAAPCILDQRAFRRTMSARECHKVPGPWPRLLRADRIQKRECMRAIVKGWVDWHWMPMSGYQGDVPQKRYPNSRAAHPSNVLLTLSAVGLAVGLLHLLSSPLLSPLIHDLSNLLIDVFARTLGCQRAEPL